MTTNALLDALGGGFVGLAPPTPGAFLYNSATGVLTYNGAIDCNIGWTDATNLVNAFNTLVGSLGSSTLSDGLGTAVSTICPGFVFSLHRLSLQAGYPGDPNSTIRTAICAAFNMWSTSILSGVAPPPPPPPAPGTPNFVRGIIVGGESMTANCCGAASGASHYTILKPNQQWQINPTTGALSLMTVPMAGVPSAQDCWIPQLADQMLAGLALENLLAGNISIPGTRFDQFAAGGVYNHLITDMLAYFKAQRVVPSSVLWAQGANDYQQSSPASTITPAVMSIILTFREAGYLGPMRFATETVFANSAPNPVVANAVAAAVALSPNCFMGANHDTILTPSLKYDGTHANYAGETALSAAWSAILAPDMA